jgi:hypothetical protein
MSVTIFRPSGRMQKNVPISPYPTTSTLGCPRFFPTFRAPCIPSAAQFVPFGKSCQRTLTFVLGPALAAFENGSKAAIATKKMTFTINSSFRPTNASSGCCYIYGRSGGFSQELGETAVMERLLPNFSKCNHGLKTQFLSCSIYKRTIGFIALPRKGKTASRSTMLDGGFGRG